MGAEPSAEMADRDSTADDVGVTTTRGSAGVCPIGASTIAAGLGGGIADRGKRTVVAVEDTADGIGVGRRKPGIGVGLRFTDGGCGDCSAVGGIVDERLGATDAGDGVDARLSGGGIVDLRDDVGATEGGNGVTRFSDGGIVEDLRDEAGSTLARTATASSSAASSPSAFRGSPAAIFVEERRDEPRAAFCDDGASGGVFPIVTTLTLIHVSQRVIHSLQKAQIRLHVIIMALE